ncbi:hypothetical protein AWC38_SpisGene18553 [Stylophora pistillata]|uniref:Uncharacterized protein n=1 Tax=Stylophora pistillata TaxID=50429 RepID=A0A2B4RK11_STYPI|nr:hypothetical protein AWC38_SpisGene18553 [Stylophora pistillata]
MWATTAKFSEIVIQCTKNSEEAGAEKFLLVNDEEIDSAPVRSSDERQHQQETGSPSSDILLGWAVHKPRSQEAVSFTSKVKRYLTTKFDLGERTGTKTDPGKVAADMTTVRNPDGSRMFERKDWLRKTQVQGFFSRLAAARRRQGSREIELEEVYAEEEEQERHEMLENVAGQLDLKHPICYDSDPVHTKTIVNANKPGPLRIPASQLTGPPWLNKVVLSCLIDDSTKILIPQNLE